MPNYTEMRLDEQIEVLEQEQKNYRLRTAKAMMWDKAHQDLGDAEKELNKETDTLEPAWKDDPGTIFVAKARNTQTVLRRWTHNIEEAKPADLLNRINALVADALPLARKNKELFEQAWGANAKMWAMDQVPVDQRASREEIEAPYRKPSGLLMNQIGDLYGQAATAVEKASGGGKFQGIDSPLKQTAPTGPGGPGGGPTGTVTGGPTAGGPTAADPAMAPNAQLTHGAIDPKTGLPIDPKTGLPVDPKTGLPVNTQQPQVGPNLVSPLGTSPTGAGPVGANPELSGGLGTAPVTAPSLSGGPGGPAPVTSLPGGGTGMPTPIVNSPIGGGGGGIGNRPPGGPGPVGGGPGGGGPGGGGPGLGGPGPVGAGGGPGLGGGGLGGPGPVGAGGARIPGVSLGGGGIGGGPGGTTIPAAAAPFQAPPTAGPAGAAPTTPPTLAAASGASAATGGGAGGMPPMMPPMGMGGMGGGSGGGPGSGAAARPTGNNNKNRRKEVVTPGLPVMLSGKAGQADMNAFAGRGRRQVAESDVPTTVQLIDEDLWQVEQKPAADERVAAPVRRAH